MNPTRRARPAALPTPLSTVTGSAGAFVVTIVFAFVGGCVSESHKVPAGPTIGHNIIVNTGTPGRPAAERSAREAPAGSSGSAGSSPQPSFVDQCPNRLEYVNELLLRFYSAYGQLPANLEDLRPLADIDLELNFTCPVSNLPYVYNPVGLQSPKSGEKRLILYDATAAHKGRRWCIVMVPPKTLGVNAQGIPKMRPLAMSVVDLSDADFKTYTAPATPAPPPTPPPTRAPTTEPTEAPGAAQPPAQPAPAAEPGHLALPVQPAPPAPPAAPAQP